MVDLRWVNGPFGCADLIDPDGTLYGYLMPLGAGIRAYGLAPRTPGQPRGYRAETFPINTEADARTWVEDQVRTMGGQADA